MSMESSVEEQWSKARIDKWIRRVLIWFTRMKSHSAVPNVNTSPNPRVIFRVIWRMFTRMKSKVKIDLTSHMKNVHSDEKLYSCTECEYSCKANVILLQHMMQVHTDERPFGCSLCKSSFKSKGVLRQHMNVHSDEKPYSCTVLNVNTAARQMEVC